MLAPSTRALGSVVFERGGASLLRSRMGGEIARDVRLPYCRLLSGGPAGSVNRGSSSSEGEGEGEGAKEGDGPSYFLVNHSSEYAEKMSTAHGEKLESLKSLNVKNPESIGSPVGGKFAVVELAGTQFKVTVDDVIVCNKLKPVEEWAVGKEMVRGAGKTGCWLLSSLSWSLLLLLLKVKVGAACKVWASKGSWTDGRICAPYSEDGIS